MRYEEYNRRYKMAQAGDIDSQIYVGKCLCEEDSASKEFAYGIRCLKYAAQKSIEAEYVLAKIYMDKLNDYETAIPILHKCFQNKHELAAVTLGKLYYEGKAVERDYKYAYNYFMEALEEKNAEAYYYYGLMCLNGYYIGRNIDSAVSAWEKAFELGRAESSIDLGKLYDIENQPFSDRKIALSWYEKSVAAKIYDYAFEVSFRYMNGDGCTKDTYRAMMYCEIAANANDPAACFGMAYGYLNGVGLEVNLDEAKKWLDKAEQLGYKNTAALKAKLDKAVNDKRRLEKMKAIHEKQQREQQEQDRIQHNKTLNTHKFLIIDKNNDSPDAVQSDDYYSKSIEVSGDYGTEVEFTSAEKSKVTSVQNYQSPVIKNMDFISPEVAEKNAHLEQTPIQFAAGNSGNNQPNNTRTNSGTSAAVSNRKSKSNVRNTGEVYFASPAKVVKNCINDSIGVSVAEITATGMTAVWEQRRREEEEKRKQDERLMEVARVYTNIYHDTSLVDTGTGMILDSEGNVVTIVDKESGRISVWH